MPLYAVDTLQLSKRLEKAGLKKEVAEELSEAIKDTHKQSLEGLVTKQDLYVTKQELRGEINSLEERLTHRIENLGNQLTIRTFGMILVAVGVIAYLDKVIT